MSSTNAVDFSVRQNKCVERSIVFDGLQMAMATLNLHDAVYVGFGSVWFVDFEMAHRQLGIETMVSMESDPVVYRRAKFNRPFRTVEILEGRSSDLLPKLLERTDLKGRPWVVWLDYDKSLDESKRDELEYLIQELPENSFLLTTFSAVGRGYGNAPVARVETLIDLFGAGLVAGLTTADCKDDRLMNLLARYCEDYLLSRALKANRPGSFIPAFRLVYKDAAPMVTVGGFLPSKEIQAEAKAIIKDPAWSGRSVDGISTPPLTSKEVQALRSTLPSPSMITRADVRALGFDLEVDQIESFVKHYLRYPSYAQLAR